MVTNALARPSVNIAANRGPGRIATHRWPGRIAIQYAAIVVGATASAGFCAATEHANPAIAGLLGLCIAGMLACMVTCVQVLRGTHPQPVTAPPALPRTARLLPAGPLPAQYMLPATRYGLPATRYGLPAAEHRLPAPVVRPALPAAPARRRPSPHAGRPQRVPSGGSR